MTQARIGVSSWSLHRSLGSPPFYGVEQGRQIPVDQHHQGALSLLELPLAIAEAGIHSLEITHFHLPSLDEGYLVELKDALAAAEVELFSLLIDDGDITHPQHGERDLAWIEGWLEVAASLGSRCVRVIAGKQQPDRQSLALSIQRLATVAAKAEALGVRLMTENWFALTSTAEAVTEIMDALAGRVGLCLDFGNWRGEMKYAQFERIAGYAESCHAKAFFHDAELDRKDYRRCLEITQKAGFCGPYTLIFESSALDEWQGLAAEQAVVKPYISPQHGKRKEA